MFFTYIDNLKRKPESVRKKHALIITTIITLVVVCIYLFSLYLHTLGVRGTEKVQEEIQKEKTTEELFNQSNQFLNSANN